MLKEKIVINDVIIASNICWDSKISQQYCSLTFTPMLDKNISHFDTAIDTVTDFVNIKNSVRVTYCWMLCSLPRSCLVHTVDRFHSKRWFSCDQVIFFVFRVFFGKKHAAFKWTDAISEFRVSPGSADALVRWGGKIKFLIAYFLSNICTKNYQHRFMYVRVIARQSSDIIGDTVYMWLQNVVIFNKHSLSKLAKQTLSCTLANIGISEYTTRITLE